MMGDKLPYDEGFEAYQAKKNTDTNPYPKSDWRHNEWYLGWSHAEETDPDQAFDFTTDSFKPEVDKSLK